MALVMANDLGELIREGRQAKGLSKAALARELGISAAALSQWESGKTTPLIDNLFAVAKILELKGDAFDNILFQTGKKLALDSVAEINIQPLKSSNVKIAEIKSFGDIDILARDIPVFGIAVGGNDGDFQFNGTESDRVTRPPGLANAKDIFALYVVNDSMYPAWREGALFYVNPNRPPVIGDDVVVEMKPQIEGEAGAAFLKRLKARRGNTIVVEQFNPPKDLEFDRDAVRLYRVIPWEEALGLS